MVRVYTLSGELLYEGHDECAAERAAERSEEPTATWTLAAVSQLEYNKLSEAQSHVLYLIAHSMNSSFEQAIKHSKTCTNCRHTLHRLAG